MTNWDNLKRDCDRAAVSDAEEGEDREADWKTRGLAERYRKHHKERRREIEATQAHEEALEPLRSISRDANAIWSRSNDSDVTELASLIERLTDYLIRIKESN